MHHSNGRGRAPRLVNRSGAALAVGAVALLLGACGGKAAVDPALVGAWDLPVPGGSWRLTIDDEGHYQFAAQGGEGGGTAPSHSGDFSAHDGEWTLHATSIALDDHGRYEVGPGNALTLTGNRGALSWGRGAPLGAPAALGNPTTPVPSAIGAVTAVPTPAPVAAPRPSPVAAPPSSAAALPDTIDPCLLVTAAEAGQLLGTTVDPERTTPQPHQQNNCRYHPKRSERSVAITTYNGGGLDVAGYLANHANGSTPLEGVGDAAYLSYHAPTGLTAVNFVIGAASFEILIAGVPRERAEPVVRELAATAAKRAVGSSAFQVPGLERFTGTWMWRELGTNGANVVVWIERDGRFRAQTLDGFAGTMTLAGSTWSVADPALQTAPNGEFSLAGDRLALRGEYLLADLTRVPCKKGASKVRPPFDLTMSIAGRLNGNGLAALNPQADGKQFDARLAGLWEGEGTTTNGRSTQALVSIDAKGRGVFALFPTTSGQFEANSGSYKILLERLGDTVGTYHFLGGVNEGLVQLVDGDKTYELRPYDPNRHPPYETPIVGHCP